MISPLGVMTAWILLYEQERSAATLVKHGDQRVRPLSVEAQELDSQRNGTRWNIR